VKQFRTKSIISYSEVLLSQASALGKQQYHDTYADISDIDILYVLASLVFVAIVENELLKPKV